MTDRDLKSLIDHADNIGVKCEAAVVIHLGEDGRPMMTTVGPLMQVQFLAFSLSNYMADIAMARIKPLRKQTEDS